MEQKINKNISVTKSIFNAIASGILFSLEGYLSLLIVLTLFTMLWVDRYDGSMDTMKSFIFFMIVLCALSIYGGLKFESKNTLITILTVVLMVVFYSLVPGWFYYLFGWWIGDVTFIH